MIGLQILIYVSLVFGGITLVLFSTQQKFRGTKWYPIVTSMASTLTILTYAASIALAFILGW